MKVFTDIQDFIGKKVFRDSRLENLKERFGSTKVAFISIEFTDKNSETCDCFFVTKEKLLDFILEDIEKAESVLEKSPDSETIRKALNILNAEKALSQELNGAELASIKDCSFLTAKPIVFCEPGCSEIPFEQIFEVASWIIFFTTANKESRGWLVRKGSDIVTAASKIHTDLARGFIRAEVYNISDLDNFKNLEEAKQKKILKVVDKDYIVEDGDVINIKFSVNK